MIIKRLILGSALLFAVVIISSTTTLGQSTVFYAPSTDVVGVQRIYLEADFITHLAAYKDGGYRIYGGRAVYGVRKRMEAGVNVYFATSAYSPEPVVVQPNFKWQFYDDESKGLAAAAGVLVSMPVTHRSAGRTSGFLYAVGSKKIAGDFGPRFTAGAYLLAVRAEKGTTKQGALIGYEQPVNRRLTFVADWTSGKNHLGYLSCGRRHDAFAEKRFFRLVTASAITGEETTRAFSATATVSRIYDDLPGERTQMMRAIDFGRSWLGDWGGRLTIAHGLVMIWFVMWLLFGTASADHKTLVTDIIQPLFCLGATCFAFRASRQKSLDARTRRAWKILSVAFFVYFTATVIWFYYEIIVGGDLGLTWADPFYFACYPIVLAGLLTFPMVRSGRSRLTFVLDTGTVVLGALMGIWHLILRPIALAAGTSPLVTIISVAFPVMGSVTLFGIVTIMLRRPDRKVRVPLAILTVAILLDAIAVLGYSYMTLQNNYEGGNWPDCFYAIGFFLMVLSAQVQYRKAKRAEPQDFALPNQRSPFPWLPYLAVGFAYSLLLFVSYKHAHASSYDLGLVDDRRFHDHRPGGCAPDCCSE